MLPWEQRPIEIANLFNPAFCCILLSDATEAYVNESQQPMEFPLAFLILPIILHKATRERLPRNITTKMHVWLQNNAEIRVDFRERTQHLIPYTREAIVYAMNAGTINVTPEGQFTRSSGRISRASWLPNSEPATIRNKAVFVGRWLARSGDVSTIYIMWGIQP